MTYADVLQKAQILAREDEIAINAKPKENGLPQKNPWNKNSQGKNDNRNRGQKRQRADDAEKKELPICDTCGKNHEYELRVAIPSGESLCAKEFLRSCRVQIGSNVLEAYLIILDMCDFDLNFCIDWLSAYRANVQC
ncbi:hypothetical protein Dsin_020719 [Dipteronia sinensis]|uniref:Uncharacterized protein n=1 Tax=Dipteronia sinensis TaxID=43782 RepID=A0AAE0AAY7_9ROSI|nr:hypothetical protein Dsin_020719 [Dipteronia sinensis]